MSKKPRHGTPLAPSDPHPHRPRKRFGQNFLQDRGIIDKIVRAIAPQAGQRLLEIGPGQGALTRPLLALCADLTVLELDRDLAAQLLEWRREFPGFAVYQGDALEFDVARLCDAGAEKLRVVGNLPYNISTPLLFHLLNYRDLIEDMHFMLQQEVVDRLSAAPGGKTWGRLSVMVQYSCEVEPLFSVPPQCFYPRPKVDSAVVRLQPRPAVAPAAENPALFQTLVNRCFQQRRKTLRNILRTWLDSNEMATMALESLEIDASIRPDAMSVADFVVLGNRLHQLHW